MMKLNNINKKIKIILMETDVSMKENEKNAIIAYWDMIKREKSFFYNGDLLSVDNIFEDDEYINISLARSNYAHYLYTKYNSNISMPCVSLAVGTIIISSDGYLLFGITGAKTEKPNVIQFIGGGDRKDLSDENGILHAALREIKEEVGEKICDSIREIKPKFIGHSIALCGILMVGKSVLSGDELIKEFHNYKKNAQNEEMNSIYLHNIYNVNDMINSKYELDSAVLDVISSMEVINLLIEWFNNNL